MSGVGWRNDQRFMAELYGRYARLMYAAAWEVPQSTRHLDDAVDEAVMRLCGHVDTLRRLSEKSCAAYICTTTRNAALDCLRQEVQQRGRAMEAEVPENWPDHHPEPLEQLVATDELNRMRRCLARLDLRERSVLEMRFMENASAAEIAKRKGVTAATIRNWIRAAQEKLKQMMEEMDDE